MHPGFIILVLLGCGGMWWVWRRLQKARALVRITSAPFPADWDDLLRAAFPPYQRMVPATRERLQKKIQRFLFEKSFEGCGELELTDEIRVLIAAHACLLTLNHRGCYPGLRAILVYPSTYVVRSHLRDDGTEGEGAARLGESWAAGTVVLSWRGVDQGAKNFTDGQNVAVHEFAHQLDQEDGVGDGIPVHLSNFQPWVNLLDASFKQLQKKARLRQKDLLSKYGATHPAEFFAVACENFFERPERMLQEHPDLYQALQHIFRLDPRTWNPPQDTPRSS